MAAGSIGFGFLAGLLSTLSPCVLPLLPLVVGSATASHRLGPAALAMGLAVSFTGLGLFVTTIGYAAGLDSDSFRVGGAVVLGILGIVLLSDTLQQHFALATGGISQAANRAIGGKSFGNLSGQFVLGLLLGAVWSPCVGPTLGAASLLAAQDRDIVQVAAVMLAFGLGTAVPLLLIGLLSREALGRWRGRMARAGKTGKVLLGGATLLIAAMILTGLDRRLETGFVAASPTWLTDLTTRY